VYCPKKHRKIFKDISEIFHEIFPEIYEIFPEIYEIFLKYFTKCFMKYFTPKNYLKFYITRHVIQVNDNMPTTPRVHHMILPGTVRRGLGRGGTFCSEYVMIFFAAIAVQNHSVWLNVIIGE